MLPQEKTGYKYAEEEYSIHLKQSKGTRELLEIEIENIFLNHKGSDTEKIVLRIQNLCGKDIKSIHEIEIEQMLNQALKEHKIIMGNIKKTVAYTDVQSMLSASETVLNKGKNLNIYQMCNSSIQSGKILNEFCNRFSLIDKSPLKIEITFNCIDEPTFHNLRLTALGWTENSEIKRIHKLTDPPFETDFSTVGIDTKLEMSYGGKLNAIKKLELEIIKEIDRICKENNIQYFLVGGSLLGAIRHNGFIPWDDDLDIGMLRKDFEKFRSICPSVLNNKYAYQSFQNEPNSHYIFDKIRLKNTWFSTKFSNKFDIENGIFVDILVYDKTSNYRIQQKIHILQVLFWSQMINMVWSGLKKSHYGYRIFKHIQWLVHKPSLTWYHKQFEKFLRKYEKNRHCKYLIDGVGQNIRKGAFPASWFDNIIMHKFEDIELPIPAEYEQYLTHWYGKKYMNIPPIEKRNSGHTLSRIDLGNYLYEEIERNDSEP